MMRAPSPYQKTSVFHAFDYLIGLVVFGFVYGIINLILPVFFPLAASDSLHGYAQFIFYGALAVYLGFGPFYFWNRIKENR